MGLATPTPARPLPRVRRLRTTRHAPPHAKEDHLPLFHDLRTASLTNMLYPFSTPNEIEQCLAAADLSFFKSLPSFNLSVQMMKSCDFLKSDFQKSDSNWLVTPPDSPLFPTLEADQIKSVTRRVRVLRTKKSNQKSPISKESKADETMFDSHASEKGRQLRRQDSKRKLDSRSQGKRNKETQKQRINYNSSVTKHPLKRQKSAELGH